MLLSVLGPSFAMVMTLNLMGNSRGHSRDPLIMPMYALGIMHASAWLCMPLHGSACLCMALHGSVTCLYEDGITDDASAGGLLQSLRSVMGS